MWRSPPAGLCLSSACLRTAIRVRNGTREKGTTMRTGLLPAIAFFVAAFILGTPVGQTQTFEPKIWTLLDNDKAPFVALPESDFRALGEGFDLPDGGRNVTELAMKAPDGAFDPRELANMSPQQLGYRPEWV